ncbi:pyridine nucleotide-disulfide oxidoreductase [delta proteobacterium NaphS2]|nr:pyridine nucleotide-disulfide oxidoreductase [delta proteobacterium NaphS2]
MTESKDIPLMDYTSILPVSSGTTAIAKTGHWSLKKPFYFPKIAPCREACPVGNDIPLFASYISKGDFDQALEILLDETPFPGVCGRVCPAPCQDSCNRGQFDQSVIIKNLERAAADYGHARPQIFAGSTGVSIGIIGAGPAGLSAAYFLRRLGHKVKVLEALDQAGGILRYGIPEYRLPKNILEKEVRRILDLGTEIKNNIRIDRPKLLKLSEEFDYLFLSSGAWLSSPLKITGSYPEEVVNGLDFLVHGKEREWCKDKKHILVVGGGDVAIDVARTARRLSPSDAHIVLLAPEALGDFPAISESIIEASEEGIEMVGGYRPVELVKTKTGLKVKLESVTVVKDLVMGSFGFVRGEQKDRYLETELVITAIGQIPDYTMIPLEALDAAASKIVVDDLGSSLLPRIFAGGDLIRQKPMVAEAIASGKRSAIAIHLKANHSNPWKEFPGLKLGSGSSLSLRAYMGKEKIDLKKVVQFDNLNLLQYRKMAPLVGQKETLERRQRGFDEVNKGLDKNTAREEANRCFSCGRCVECDLCFLLCPDLSIIKEPGHGYTVNNDYCKGCGICVTTCPRYVLEI